jgi:hypothetical protein
MSVSASVVKGFSPYSDSLSLALNVFSEASALKSTNEVPADPLFVGAIITTAFSHLCSCLRMYGSNFAYKDGVGVARFAQMVDECATWLSPMLRKKVSETLRGVADGSQSSCIAVEIVMSASRAVQLNPKEWN